MRSPQLNFDGSRAGSGAGCAIWAVRIFILPHTIAGIFLIGQALLTFGWFAGGANISGRVVRAWAEPHRKGTSYLITFEYDAGGRTERCENEGISQTAYDRLPGWIRGRRAEAEADPNQKTAAISLRLFKIGRFTKVNPLPPYGAPPGAELGTMIFMAVFWNGILSVFLYNFWIKPSRLSRPGRFPSRTLPR